MMSIGSKHQNSKPEPSEPRLEKVWAWALSLNFRAEPDTEPEVLMPEPEPISFKLELLFLKTFQNGGSVNGHEKDVI
jgi:hypothetical protein